MKNYLTLFIILSTYFLSSLFAVDPSDQKLKTLYSSLDPTSLSQHLAFYELYGHRPLGQQALKDARQILAGKQSPVYFASQPIPFSNSVINALIALVNKQHARNLKFLMKEIFKKKIDLQAA